MAAARRPRAIARLAGLGVALGMAAVAVYLARAEVQPRHLKPTEARQFSFLAWPKR